MIFLMSGLDLPMITSRQIGCSDIPFASDLGGTPSVDEQKELFMRHDVYAVTVT
jgi:hypothetical protein